MKKRTLMIQLICIAVLLVFVLIDFEPDTMQSTYTYKTTISNVEYYSKKHVRWITFDTDNGKAYYKLHSNSFYFERQQVEEDIKTFQCLCDNNIEVQVRVSEKRDFLSLTDNHDRLRVVAIEDDQQVYFSLDDHNDDQKSTKSFFCIVLLLWLACLLGYYRFMRFLSK